jgi:RNA polymerase sigma factor (sigma-70 family)
MTRRVAAWPDWGGGIAVTTTEDAPTPLTGQRRWSVVWKHRPRLLRIARRRCASEHDAEDVVAEALLRAMESPHVVEERLPAWLTTVTVRLCIDAQRERAREQRVWSRTGPPAATASCEERVCELSEAAWVARRLTALPVRQAQALRLRASGLDIGGVARSLGVSYRTAESLLARGRAAARGWLVCLLGALAVLAARWGRWRTVRISAIPKAVAVSAGLAAVGVAVVAHSGAPHGARPAAPHTARAAAPGAATAAPGAAAAPASARRAAAAPAAVSHPARGPAALTSPGAGGPAGPGVGGVASAPAPVAVSPTVPAAPAIPQPQPPAPAVPPAVPAPPRLAAPQSLPGHQPAAGLAGQSWLAGGQQAPGGLP